MLRQRCEAAQVNPSTPSPTLFVESLPSGRPVLSNADAKEFLEKISGEPMNPY